MQIASLDHLVLTVADIAKTVDFYSTVLGMTPLTFESGGVVRHALAFGSQKFNLHQSGHVVDPNVRHATPGSADLCLLTTTPIADVVLHLQRSGVPIILGPVPRTGAVRPLTSVYFHDPDENLVELSNALDESNASPAEGSKMKLWSESFRDGGEIPATSAFGMPDARAHVALSDNRNPHLGWDGVPDGTLSFALIVHDVDVPSRPDDVNQEDRLIPADLPRVDFFHWVLFDLPGSMRAIDEGSFSKAVTPHGKHGPMIQHSPVEDVLHGMNGYTEWFAGDPDMAGDYYGYDGPCPPWNDSIAHRYVFTLYALSVDRLIVTGRVTGEAVRAALVGNVVAEASITGLYSLNPRLFPPGFAPGFSTDPAAS